MSTRNASFSTLAGASSAAARSWAWLWFRCGSRRDDLGLLLDQLDGDSIAELLQGLHVLADSLGLVPLLVIVAAEFAINNAIADDEKDDGQHPMSHRHSRFLFSAASPDSSVKSS